MEKNVKNKNFKEKLKEEFIQRRQVFLWGAVTDKSSEEIIENMLYLEYIDPGKQISFFINSPGGIITSGMAIYDVMNSISSPIYTITIGMAASMGAILFGAGVKGHRYILKHAKVMIHQPLISGQIIAPAMDIKIRAEEIKKTRMELNQILSKSTGKDISIIQKDTDRDFYMNSEEAIKYGIADKLIHNIKEIPNTIKSAKAPKKTSSKK